MSLFREIGRHGRPLPLFFRSTLAWYGYVETSQSESPEKIKIIVTVFTFHKPVYESQLSTYVLDELLTYERHYQKPHQKAVSGFETAQVSHDEARGLGFYRVAVAVDDEIIRKEALY